MTEFCSVPAPQTGAPHPAGWKAMQVVGLPWAARGHGVRTGGPLTAVASCLVLEADLARCPSGRLPAWPCSASLDLGSAVAAPPLGAPAAAGAPWFSIIDG